MDEKSNKREHSVTSPEWFSEDDSELAVRPKLFSEFIGQNKITDNLKIFIQAAINRKEALDHVLLTGPPGLGKTTLSFIIANELRTDIKVSSGPVLEKPGDLAGLLTNLTERDVLFIDEIHRLSPTVEEYLYSAMEEFRLDIMIDSGPSARTIQISLPKFTLIGATTRAGLLTAPLRSRFGISGRLDYYDKDDIYSIVRRSAKMLGIPIEDRGADEIASRSRGTPRIANRLLRRTRDFAEVRGNGVVTIETAKTALLALDVDEYGLDDMDKRIIETLVVKFGGGPVGINTLAIAVSEEPGTIEEVYEPFLIQKGFINRTPRGRMATDAAYRHLKLNKNQEINDSLF